MRYELSRRKAPPGSHHRPPGTPRHRTLCVMTYRGKKLRSAPPGPRHRPPGTSRSGPLCVMSFRGERLRSALPRPRHPLPRTPIRRTLCVITYRGEKLRSAPPGLGRRPPWRPRRGTLCFMIYRHEKLRCAPPGTRHQLNEFAYEPSILPFLRIVLVHNRTVNKININVLLSVGLTIVQNCQDLSNDPSALWQTTERRRNSRHSSRRGGRGAGSLGQYGPERSAGVCRLCRHYSNLKNCGEDILTI